MKWHPVFLFLLGQKSHYERFTNDRIGNNTWYTTKARPVFIDYHDLVQPKHLRQTSTKRSTLRLV